MNIEQTTALPTEASPEVRYASLHRTVEAGLVGDSTWADLCRVCAELDKKDEASMAYEQIEDRSIRLRMQSHLIQKGILGRPAAEKRHVTDADLSHPFGEEVADSFRFLFYEHMPLTVLVSTMTFPLVIGLGGFLTKGTSSLVLPAIALIPALSVIGLVGTLSRRILVDASHGIDDPPRLPGITTLAKESSRFLLDGLLLAVLLLGPAIGAVLLGAGFWAILSSALLGTALLPMAMAIRQLTDDWSVLSPNVLFTAVCRGGRQYATTAAIAIGLLTPAALSVYMTLGSALFMTVSVVGPLVVAPMFIISRLMGRLLDTKRASLGALTGMPAQKTTSRLAATAMHGNRAQPAYRQQATNRQAAPSRQQAPAKQASSPAREATSNRRLTTQPERRERARTPLSAAASHPEARRRPASPRPQVKTPSKSKVAAAEANTNMDIVGEAAPDLTQMPGFNVVSGKARVLAGASSGSGSHKR